MEKILLVEGNKGIYGPQVFAKRWASSVIGYHPQSIGDLSENVNICKKGPDHAVYWDAWDEVSQGAKLIIDGQEYTLEESDGGLWAVPVRYEEPDDECERLQQMSQREMTDQEANAEHDRRMHEEGPGHIEYYAV